MKHDPGGCSDLELDLLRLYKRAVYEGQLDAAEPLLRALKELAKPRPDSKRAVELAYLYISGRCANGPRCA